MSKKTVKEIGEDILRDVEVSMFEPIKKDLKESCYENAQRIQDLRRAIFSIGNPEDRELCVKMDDLVWDTLLLINYIDSQEFDKTSAEEATRRLRELNKRSIELDPEFERVTVREASKRI